MALDILFVIGLPRSGTSLVQKLVHEETGRKSPTFRQFGVDVSRVPSQARALNRTFKDEDSLAEDNDYSGYSFQGSFYEYKQWLERRGDYWVLKSPDHIGQLGFLIHEFPEARFLWCMRPMGEVMASIREYWQVTGVGPPYDIVNAVNDAAYIAKSLPERFDCVWTHSIPEWESDRDDVIETPEAFQVEIAQRQVKGVVRNVSSREFKQYYSREGTGVSGA